MNCIACGKEGVAGTCAECQAQQIAIVNARVARAQEPKIDDGGPAFPCPEKWPDFSGMTLRDYFAAKALPGLIASHIATHGSLMQSQQAVWAYEYADAMIAAQRPQAKGGAA